ncbi:MAG: hypothetical protein ACXV9S_13120 [Acidimicrobiia bacterium]
MGTTLDASGPHPGFQELLVRPASASAPTAPTRSVVELLALRGLAGDFVVPAASRRSARAPLRAYNRLRPARVRAARAAIAAAIGLGLGDVVGTRRTITATPGDAVLLDHLATVLDEPDLRLAGTDRPCRDLVTPVLQLFSASGSCVGFAKLGWDPVTAAMVDNEADALRRATRAGEYVSVPEVRWHGRWYDLAVLVTAPMPRRVHRLGKHAPAPLDPLPEIASVDGPMVRTPLRASGYWISAAATALEAAVAGRPTLADRVEAVEATWGGAELRFGRWHGDWVAWNLAADQGRLHAWDWAYSAPAVPFGYDAVHYSYLPHEVLGGRTRADAVARARVEATPALRALGLDADEADAVLTLHALELERRETRAWLTRHASPATAATPEVGAA